MKITQAVFDSITQQAKKEMPYESCGYLAEKNGTIIHHYEMTNTDKAADHFSMDPGEQFDAVKDMRSRDLKMAAVYHSHPETPARPSEEDIRLAYDPNTSYVIISLAGPKPIIKSFKIQQGNVTPEEIEII